MEEVRQYILSVICVAILSCLIQTPIAGKGGIATAVKIATGLVLTVTVFTPILNLGNFRLKDVNMAISSGEQWAISEGESVAREQLIESVEQQTRAYILHKANAYGADITVDVCVEGETIPVPSRITLSGKTSPYIKQQLSESIKQDLGIAEEDQIWIS